MDIEVRLASSSERLIVRHLMELYQHDFSEIDGSELDEHGQYGYFDLDCFWINPAYSAYVFKVSGKWAGFALVNDEVYVQGNTRAIVEFFIVRKYRSAGIGSHAAQAIFDMKPACWEIRVCIKNTVAEKFWKKLLTSQWPDLIKCTAMNNETWRGPIFSLDNRTQEVQG